MSTPEEQAGFSRRDMLKRSAVVGGTLLWVTPTVSVLSAGPAAAASDAPQGDGTHLDTSYYLLAFNCGGTFYLVKVGKTERGAHKPFTLEYGSLVKGNHNDPNDGWPTSETQGIARRHTYALQSAGLPPKVKLYVVRGELYVDLYPGKKLPKDACTLDYWTAHNGKLYFKQGGLGYRYNPQQPDQGDKTVLRFPLLPNK